jgi:hypothetical protein
MSLITITYVFSAGATIIASQHNTNFSTIYSDYNGNITDANIASGAAILGSKLNLASPPAIGATAPSTGAFTTLTASTSFLLGSAHQGDVLYDNGTTLVRLTPGTSGQFLQTQGAAANPQWAAGISIPSNIQLFTASGTWTKPAGISQVYVKLWAAGGGGWGTSGTATAGGNSSFAGTVTLSAVGGGAAGNSTAGSAGTGGTNTNGYSLPGSIGATGSSVAGGSAAVLLSTINNYGSGGAAGSGANGASGGGGEYTEAPCAVTGNVTVTVGAAGTHSAGGGSNGAGGAVIVYY